MGGTEQIRISTMGFGNRNPAYYKEQQTFKCRKHILVVIEQHHIYIGWDVKIARLKILEEIFQQMKFLEKLLTT